MTSVASLEDTSPLNLKTGIAPDESLQGSTAVLRLKEDS